MGILRNIYSLIRNIPEYIKKGGITYLSYKFVDYGEVLQGKNIVITGGASGIGYAIAKMCVDSGAKVLIIGRNEKKLNAAIKELGSTKACALKYDIGKVDEVDEKVNEMYEILNGNIDGLVNCAGVAGQKGFDDIDATEYDRVMDSCLKGTYFLTEKIFKRMVVTKTKGNIVMVSSNGSVIGHVKPYGLAKAGMNNYAVGIAKMGVLYGIRCNVIAPGYTCTSLTENFAKVDPAGNIFKGDVRDKRWHLPEEMAQIALFLLSDASSCLNGQILLCDGGDTLL